MLNVELANQIVHAGKIPGSTKMLALLPGFPHAQMKIERKGESLVKTYHVRNVIGRENLIACMQRNELAQALRPTERN